ncbi:MAG: M43 family zinc metalloprotease [Crocinitomicaceae bacterium]|nr:M43 family zinc metalloprotease [Crocinitomicaceae bacterium]
MKKTILSALGILAFSAISLSQTQTTQIDPTNVREGESVEYCKTHKKKQELLLNPAAVASFAQDEVIRQQEEANGVPVPKGTVYYIPTVFHVLHNGGIENISDEQIMDALSILNRDYRLLNADANNVNAAFQGLPADVEIEFRMATIAPNGACFNGITRTQSALSNDGSSGTAQVQAIINGNDVYNGQFPGDEYMNIFICGDIDGAAGYTYTPSNWIGTSMANGIWVLHNYVGSIGTSSTFTSRTLTHEAGHWLNLEHPWGGNNNPGNASSCSTDDGVSDTPNTIGVTSCNQNEATCGPLANVENYMDYSYCSKMFTPGQVTRARNAITSGVGGRSNLITSGNLAATGATGSVYLCSAEFEADRTTICAGNTINFDDQSFNAVNGWTWTFTGGTPATSTSENPSVTYNTPGLYTVTLNSTDGTNNDTETKTSYIRVLPAAASIPFYEGFESYSTLNNIEPWEVINPAGNAWQLHTGTGHTGNKCAKIVNFGQTAGNFDDLISSPIDLSSINSTTGMTMSFRYSYVQRYSSNSEVLKVYVTPNCGENWAPRKTLSGTQLSPTAQNSAWTPTSQADWTTVHMTNITSAYWTDQMRARFEFKSDGGNNIYLDDINIYAGAPSDVIVADVAENGFDIEALSVFPNPTEEDLNIRFTLKSADQANLIVQDVTGKITQSATINATEGSNLVLMNTADLASGMYFLNVQIGGSQKTIQFVVK